MSVSVLVTGALFRDPEQRTAGSGRQYVMASLKAAGADNEQASFWDVLCFSDTTGAELLRLKSGDHLSVQGRLKLETYEARGETRISRKIFVEAVLALRAAPKERKSKKDPTPTGHHLEPVSIVPPVEAAPRQHGDLGDDIPF